ncbi:MAG: hypothetical protein JXX29_09485 [Deltaproteobacteria bacterium]|nr:hypothetical protein [Deltaproteobacteria bacterium]MBN2671896.1 hypothetical protein [Deltaproteobacteria bacterium]
MEKTMILKIWGIVSAILLVTAVVVGVQQYKMSDNISRLTMRVAELEVQNVELSRQLSGLPAAESDVSQRRGRRSVRSDRGVSTPVKSNMVSGDNGKPEVDTIKADLRQELAQMVEAEQSESREKHREERETRMANLMSLSIRDFAEDQGLNDDVADELEQLMEQSMTERRTLRDELESENISFYEYRQEQRKRQAAMDEKLSKLMNEKQREAFQDAFPFGRRGGGPPR